MQSRFANRFGVAAITIAVLAVVASVWAMLLPYRLSQAQNAILETAFVVQSAGPLLASIFGYLALEGDKRSRRFGIIAIVFSVVAFILGIVTADPHSVGHS